MSPKKTIAILTGGGDCPGLNPAIRGVVARAESEGYRVIGIRRGWAGLVDMIPDKDADNSEYLMELTGDYVIRQARTGGTFLHTSRTRPSHLPLANVPEYAKNEYTKDINDFTPQVLKNLEFLGVDTLVPIGGDDTLSYAWRLHQEGFKVVAVPKTMDNDVPGTDYCIGFGTCISRTIELTNRMRTTAGSHERFLVVEVFGRYAGFTAMLPCLAGAANRCLIPEHDFDIEQVARLLAEDRLRHTSHYSVLLVSEGARFKGEDEMSFMAGEADMFGHRKLGGIGDKVSAALQELSPKFGNGKKVSVINQRLGYLTRCGEPDALDSIVPMAYGNLAMDLILKGVSGRMVNVRNGIYGNVEIDSLLGRKKIVNVEKFYNTERLRPNYNVFNGNPMLVMGDEDK